MPDWSAAGSNVNARLLVVACVALWWSCQVGSEPVPHMAHGAADHEGSKEDGRAESLVVAGDAAPGPDRELQRRDTDASCSTTMLPCEETSDPTLPCAHDCCDPTGLGTAGFCVPFGGSFICACSAPYVSTADNKACVCPSVCPSGTIQTSDCKCECPITFTCVGSACSRRACATGGVVDIFTPPCTSCSCQLVSCDASAQSDRDGDCQCKDIADRCVSPSSPSSCRHGTLNLGRNVDYWNPSCSDCSCEKKPTSCTSPTLPMPFAADQTYTGLMVCQTLQFFTLKNFFFPDPTSQPNLVQTTYAFDLSISGNVYHGEYTMSGTYDPVGACIEFVDGPMIQDPWPPGTPGLPVYRSVSLYGRVDNQTGKLRFQGEVPECRYSSFTATLDASCDPTTQYLNDGSCKTLTECSLGEIETTAPTSVSDRECTACDGVQQYQDEAGQTLCKPVRTCHPGTFASAAPTSSSDRVCSTCSPPAQYQNLPAQTACKNSTACGPGTVEQVAPTPTSDRVCSACDGVATYEDPTDPLACRNVTVCPLGWVETQPPTPTSDRACRACNTTAGEFQDAFDQTACKPQRQCMAGEFVVLSPSQTSDRQCQSCADIPGTFSDQPNAANCSAWAVCPSGEEEMLAPTPSSDRVCVSCVLGATFKAAPGPATCQPVNECPPGAEALTAPTTTADWQCRPCAPSTFKAAAGANTTCTPTTPCPPGAEQEVSPTPSSDRVCSPCLQGQTFKPLGGQSTSCQPVTPPCNASTHYESIPPTPTSDRLCAPLTVCRSGAEFQPAALAPTPTSDRTCVPCTRCNEDSDFETAPCTPTTDRRCSNCSACVEGVTFAAEPCSVDGGDTRCQPCRSCAELPSPHFQSAPCTVASNTGCQPVAVCNASVEFESAAPTPTSNRRCAPLTACNASTEFERSAPTATSNRICAAISPPCRLGQHQTDAPSSTSDRVCRDCAAGDLDADRNSATPCMPCPPGSFVPAGSAALQSPPPASVAASCAPFVCPPGTVDGDGDPSSPCTTCPSNTFQPDANATACLPATTCQAGEQVLRPLTSVLDRRCEPCQPGLTFNNQTNTTSTSACRPVTVCAAGQTEQLAPTTSSDRLCMPCPPDTFKASPGSANCTAVQLCAPGSEEALAPTPTSDRTCRACVAGATFQDLPTPTPTTPAVCKPVSECASGFEELLKPTARRDRQCRQCTLGATFKADAGQASQCALVSDCPPGAEEVAGPTLTSDRECRACALATTYKDVKGQSPCLNVTQCAAGFEETAAPTRSSDRQCAPCVLGQTFKAAAGQASRCIPVTPCQTVESVPQDPDKPFGYVAVAATTSSDRICSPLRECAPGVEFQSLAPTAARNRECSACSVCPPSGAHFETAPCTPTSDRACQGCATCTAGATFLQAECTNTSDTLCAPCQICDLRSQYIVRECSLTRDRECAPSVSCSSLGYETYEQVPPSIGRDRVCANATVCNPATSFESTPLTPTSDRECSLLSPACRVGTVQQKAPTPTSDRVCKPCPAGTTDADFDPSTPCFSCVGGYYIGAGRAGPCSSYECPPGTADDDFDSSTPCAACTLGAEYQDLSGQLSCKPVVACPAGQEEAVPPTATTPRVCAPCVAGLTYKAVPGQETACVAVSDCPPGEEELQPPTLIQDRRCIPCSATTFKPDRGQQRCRRAADCGLGQGQVVAPTPTSDRACAVCPSGKFNDLDINNGPCQTMTECTDEQYQEAAGTTKSDRVCASLTVCDAKTEVQIELPTATSDRVCLLRADLHLSVLEFAADYTELVGSSPERASEFRTRLRTLLLATLQGTASFLDVELRPGSILADVYVDTPEAKRDIDQAAFYNRLNLTLPAPGGDGGGELTLPASLYTAPGETPVEELALDRALAAFEAARSSGRALSDAVTAAAIAYRDNGGLRDDAEQAVEEIPTIAAALAASKQQATAADEATVGSTVVFAILGVAVLISGIAIALAVYIHRRVKYEILQPDDNGTTSGKDWPSREGDAGAGGGGGRRRRRPKGKVGATYSFSPDTGVSSGTRRADGSFYVNPLFASGGERGPGGEAMSTASTATSFASTGTGTNNVSKADLASVTSYNSMPSAYGSGA